MKPYPHERLELARELGRSCDLARELHFFLRRRPDQLHQMAKDARTGKRLSPTEIDDIRKRLKSLAVEAVHSLDEAHAQAAVYFAENDKEQA